MFVEERKSKIIQILEEEERVDVIELGKLLDVSESTIRRDLKELEDANLLKRTHGGAVSIRISKPSVTIEPSFLEKEIQYPNEKKAIAKKAVEFIKDGDTILLDSGTTTFYILQELKTFNHLTVVTNAIISPAYLELLHPGIELLFLGGTYRPQTQSLVGMFTEQCLNMIRVDKCFIATNGAEHSIGLTTPNMTEAEIKRKMISCAQQVILVTDSSKFGKSSFAKFADLDDIDVCITDSGIREEEKKSLSRSGITVITADFE